MGWSRTGHAGHSICTTSIRLNHSAMGSTSAPLLDAISKGTPASSASAPCASDLCDTESDLSPVSGDEFIEQIHFVEQGKVFAQLGNVERRAVSLYERPDVVKVTRACGVVGDAL